MKRPRVRLYIRVRVPNRAYIFLSPVWNRNQTPRAGYALVNGQPEHHPEGIYYLRYRRGSKPVWQAVGCDADAAMVALRNTEHDLQAVTLGRASLRSKPGPDSVTSVSDAVNEYLSHVRSFRSRKTIAACEQMLGLFASRLAGRSVTSLTRKDLLDHMSVLQQTGKGPRTVHNHMARIGTFLRSRGITGLLNHDDQLACPIFCAAG